MIQAHYVNVLDCQNLETIPFKLEDVSGMTDLAKSNPIFLFISDNIVYIEYLIYEAKFHLVLIQMMSNLFLNIEMSPQMCYNKL